MRFTLVLLCATVVSIYGCGGDATGPQPSGLYTLESIDGQRVPVYRTTPPAPGVDGHQTLYRSGSLTLGDTVVLTLDKSVEWPRSTYTDLLIRSWGTLERRMSQHTVLITRVQINSDPPAQVLMRNPVTALAGDSIVIIDEGGYMLYRKDR